MNGRVGLAFAVIREAEGFPIEQSDNQGWAIKNGHRPVRAFKGTGGDASTDAGARDAAQTRRRETRRGSRNRRTPSLGAFRGARRYSRFVQAMKFVLPVVALTILIAMGLYTMVYKVDDRLTVTFANSPSLSNDRSTIYPKFTIPLKDGRMFGVMANSAEPLSKDNKLIELRGLKADLKGEIGADIRLRADKGLLDLDAQTMTISESVQLVSDQGYEFRTERVIVNLKDQTVHSDQPVTGTSPMGTITAKEFWVLDKGRRLKFSNGVVMDVEPKAIREQRLAEAEAEAGNLALKGSLKVTLEPVTSDVPAPYESGSADERDAEPPRQ